MSQPAGASAGGERLSEPVALVVLVLYLAVGFFASGYLFVGPASNQVEQLPLLMHSLNGSLLANDWFMHEMSDINVRTFFVLALTPPSRAFGIAPTYFTVYCLAFLATPLITYAAVTRTFRGTPLAGLIAGMLSMALTLFWVGIQLTLPTIDSTVPETIARPLSLAAIALAASRRPVACAAVTTVAALIHPLVGLIPGVIALVAMFASDAAARRVWRAGARAVRACARPAATGLALMVPIAAFWIVIQGRAGADPRFIEALVKVRAPHHYLVGYQQPLYLVGLAVFYVATLLLTLAWSRARAPGAEGPGAEGTGDRSRERLGWFVVACMALLALLVVIGYVFVTLIPLVDVATLQTMRYLYIAIWLGTIAIGLVAAQTLPRLPPLARLAQAVLLVGANWIVQPFSMLAGSAGVVGFEMTRRRAALAALTAAVTLAAAGVAIAYATQVQLDPFPYLTVLALVLTCACVSAPAALRAPLAIGLAAAALVIPFALSAIPATTDSRWAFAATRIHPTLDGSTESWSPRPRALAHLARHARRIVPRDAIVLTAPQDGVFRVLAGRAIVVDFKAFPFGHEGAWLDRMLDVYSPDGKVPATGFAFGRRLDDDYRNIGTARMRRAMTRYGARYAVLFRETPTSCPTLYANRRYRLVSLNARCTRG